MNRIPRNAKKLEVTLLTETNVGKAGTCIIVEKNEHSWVGEIDGHRWSFFSAQLRNDSLCQIKVIETDPPLKSTPTPCR